MCHSRSNWDDLLLRRCLARLVTYFQNDNAGLVTGQFPCYNEDMMRHLANFLDKCLQVFVVLLCVLAHLFLGWQFVILVGHLGQERLTRALWKHARWGVKPHDLRHALYPYGEIERQAHFVEWRPVTKEMWAIYDPESNGK